MKKSYNIPFIYSYNKCVILFLTFYTPLAPVRRHLFMSNITGVWRSNIASRIKKSVFMADVVRIIQTNLVIKLQERNKWKKEVNNEEK